MKNKHKPILIPIIRRPCKGISPSEILANGDGLKLFGEVVYLITKAKRETADIPKHIC